MDIDNKQIQPLDPQPVISPNLPSQPIIASTFTSNSQDNNVSYASFWIRLLAFIIDLIILRFFSFLIGLYFGVLITFLRLSTENVTNTIGRIPDFFLYYFFYVFYSTLFLSIYSATPGKYLCRLKVTGENNKKINTLSSLIRSLLQPFSTTLFGIGYVSMLKSDKKQAWHDKIAQTTVIRSRDPRSIIKTIIISVFVYLVLIFLLMAIILIKNNLFR